MDQRYSFGLFQISVRMQLNCDVSCARTGYCDECRLHNFAIRQAVLYGRTIKIAADRSHRGRSNRVRVRIYDQLSPLPAGINRIFSHGLALPPLPCVNRVWRQTRLQLQTKLRLY